MTTYSFYGVIQPVLAAGSYTGDTPNILQEGLYGRSHAIDYGIILENGDTPEIGSDHQGTILYRKISGIIHAWAQKQTTLDTLEQDILDILEDSSLSYEVKNIAQEIHTNNFEKMIQVEVLA